MNPNAKVYAAAKLNGTVTHWDQIEFKHVPIKLAQLIMASPLTPQQFSNLELRVSKRPISFATDSDSQWLEDLQINQIDDNEPFDDVGDITHAELADLAGDSIWRNMQYLQITEDAVDSQVAEQIREAWRAKYGQSKFARLMQ